jgi:hypothetical protein
MYYPPFRISKNSSDQLQMNPPFNHPLLDSVALVEDRFAIHDPKGKIGDIISLLWAWGKCEPADMLDHVDKLKMLRGVNTSGKMERRSSGMQWQTRLGAN